MSLFDLTFVTSLVYNNCMKTHAERQVKYRYMKKHGITSEEYEVLFYPPELRTRKYRRDNALTPLERNRYNRYHISREGVLELLKFQDNKCALCGTVIIYNKMHVDHCHTTGKVRGLLCMSCNMMLGRVGDNVPFIHKILFYLTK